MIATQAEWNGDTDADLRRRVNNFLAERMRPGLRQLNVEVDSGVVKLQGKLRSFYEKQLAINCCQRVAGVMELVDEVEVAL